MTSAAWKGQSRGTSEIRRNPDGTGPRLGIKSEQSNYYGYLAKRAKRSQDASNQLPDQADGSIATIDEEEPQNRHLRRAAGVIAADWRVSAGTGRWRALLPLHVPLGGRNAVFARLHPDATRNEDHRRERDERLHEDVPEAWSPADLLLGRWNPVCGHAQFEAINS